MIKTAHKYIDSETGVVLDAWFPQGDVNPARSSLAQKVGLIKGEVFEFETTNLSSPPISPEDVYYRLHLLSKCQAAPNSINLTGIFALLTNVAWTSAGPVLPSKVNLLRSLIADQYHHLTVSSIDKFPRMTDYIIPLGVRIADADRVRLGAHLAQGTTVMHEGFVNFNAGTLGASMVEGRVTPGVIVGKNSDIGAGASIMGTLSGGGQQVNSIGERSLVGANAGIGISLGDECIVEAGLYITAGTKVTLIGGEVVAARALSGENGLLFRRNSINGKVEALATSDKGWGRLNSSLHTND